MSGHDQAVLRANAQLSHFATASGDGGAFCDRCGKPLNRWDEKCDYQQTAAHLLAEYVLALVAENQQLRDALETIARTDEVEFPLPDWQRRVAVAALAGTPSEDTDA